MDWSWVETLAEVDDARAHGRRLADWGMVEACWQDEPGPGRPRRHLYRLTAAGLASASAALVSAARPTTTKARTTVVRGAVVGVAP